MTLCGLGRRCFGVFFLRLFVCGFWSVFVCGFCIVFFFLLFCWCLTSRFFYTELVLFSPKPKSSIEVGWSVRWRSSGLFHMAEVGH